MNAERKVEIITDILEGDYAEAYFEHRQDDVEQATLEAISNVTHGEQWYECQCQNIESWNLPEEGCPHCDDEGGTWA